MSYVKDVDLEVYNAIVEEEKRQEGGIELIASENFVSKAVMEAAGSVFTNKYAEGYPGKRYYGGCVNADVVESLAIERLKQVFEYYSKDRTGKCTCPVFTVVHLAAHVSIY